MTTATNSWPLGWQIAVALALECGLDWARWACGENARCHKQSCKAFEWIEHRCAWCGIKSVPVVDPADAEAYKADCARRQVEPGPMPSLEYGTDESPVWWIVETFRRTTSRPEYLYTRVRVGTVEAHHNGRCWAGLYARSMAGIATADMLKLGRMMQAVDAALAATRAKMSP